MESRHCRCMLCGKRIVVPTHSMGNDSAAGAALLHRSRKLHVRRETAETPSGPGNSDLCTAIRLGPAFKPMTMMIEGLSKVDTAGLKKRMERLTWCRGKYQRLKEEEDDNHKGYAKYRREARKDGSGHAADAESMDRMLDFDGNPNPQGEEDEKEDPPVIEITIPPEENFKFLGEAEFEQQDAFNQALLNMTNNAKLLHYTIATYVRVWRKIYPGIKGATMMYPVVRLVLNFAAVTNIVAALDDMKNRVWMELHQVCKEVVGQTCTDVMNAGERMHENSTTDKYHFKFRSAWSTCIKIVT